MSVRIIPRLDIKGTNLVKGIHLEGLRVVGRPEHFARHYYEQGADELLYIDIVASLYERNRLLDLITKTSQEIFIPLTVGGGLRTLDDIRSVLLAGADKVAINTAAVRSPELIREAAQRFGSSTIVLSIEAMRKSNGTYEAFTENGRVPTGYDTLEWAVRGAELGAGEILLTSIDREGTGSGFDVELTAKIARAVSIPVIACGGAGGVEHVSSVITEGRADAVSIASILHYDFLKQYKSDEPFTEGNIDYLQGSREFTRIQTASMSQLKKYLISKGIFCRESEHVRCNS